MRIIVMILYILLFFVIAIKHVHPSIWLIFGTSVICLFCDPLEMFIKWSEKYNATRWLSYGLYFPYGFKRKYKEREVEKECS